MTAPDREVLRGWGGANHARSWIYRPTCPEAVARAIRDARDRGLSIAHRGAGQSYGDAALNEGGAVIVTAGMDRVLEYDPDRGVVRAEAGVTIGRLWREVVADGWWPPVVPGTARSTVGGCLAMNVHGKNHPRAGSFAEYVRCFSLLDEKGTVHEVRPGDRRFRTVPGAQGLTGTILSVEIDLTRIHSGYLQVEARSSTCLAETMDTLEVLGREHDYAVAWIDAFATGTATGRGEVHGASYLPEGHEREGAALAPAVQQRSAVLSGALPSDRMASGLRWVLNDTWVRTGNAVNYAHARLGHPKRYLQTHAAFHFLLDRLPGWRRAYGEGGLIQYQLFVPAASARTVFAEALRRQRRRGITSYLAVVKRHRSDPFPVSYAVDGWSLALDFPVRTRTLSRLSALMRDFDRLQADAGGAVYAAKDAVSRLGRLPEARSPVFSSNLVRRWERSGGRP